MDSVVIQIYARECTPSVDRALRLELGLSWGVRVRVGVRIR